MGRHTGDRASTGTDTDGRPVNKTVEVAQDLAAAFERIKSVKGVYQQEITRGEAPDIYLYGTVEAISLPLVNKQAKEMVDTALVGSYNVNDEDAENFSKEPACVFNAGSFDIRNPRWEGYVQELAGLAAEGLGLETCELKAELDAMWLWTEGCDWPTPSLRVRKHGCRQTWAAKMLVILPSTHEGGEVTFTRNGNLDTWSTDGHRQSMICWHKDIKLEFKPPEKGNRLGLLYDLHVRRPLKYSQQRATHHSAVQAVQDAIEKYTVLVRNECIQETAFFLPLSTRIPKHTSQRPEQSSIGKHMLLPSDLAKVECFSEKGMDEVRGFETHIALAEVTARDKMTIYRAWGTKMVEHLDTEYLLQKVVDTQEGDNIGEQLRRLEGTKLDAELIPVVDAFNSDLTRMVTHQGDTEEHVFLKTTLCLLIHFEQLD
ncbi:hypothetical protein VPNG_07767 [Cytospora leucostoma]|uniref:Uncharacterized protein n=1 Tax=Cytospora leucostoma TaxID=1230097 RepID=A0A423W8F4_9PEZI|nr:hypothetical protein VPNG_07767 [Cytospora leucostoma]